MAWQSISREHPLLLGSASPRRREILTGLGIPLRVLPADVSEEQRPGDTPESYLERVVNDKLGAVLVKAHQSQDSYSAALVADTVVLIDGQILGKPADATEACALLSLLVGRAHQVHTRYALGRDGLLTARTVCSHVWMRTASLHEIKDYAETGEGFDKAGAYAAQGIGAFLIERIDGSYSNVVGLPACEVILDLKRLGILQRFPLALF
jgi:septum formation protein